MCSLANRLALAWSATVKRNFAYWYLNLEKPAHSQFVEIYRECEKTLIFEWLVKYTHLKIPVQALPVVA
jgi:hypothetical protein